MPTPTPFARRLARLGLTTAAAAQIVGVPQATAENWRQGRARTPRPVMRLLALWGRLTLNQRAKALIANRRQWPPHHNEKSNNNERSNDTESNPNA